MLERVFLPANFGVNRSAAGTDAGKGQRFSVSREHRRRGVTGGKLARGSGAAAVASASLERDGNAFVPLAESKGLSAFRNVHRHGEKPAFADSFDFRSVHIERFLRVGGAENRVFIGADSKARFCRSCNFKLGRNEKIRVLIEHAAFKSRRQKAGASVCVFKKRAVVRNAKADSVKPVY